MAFEGEDAQRWTLTDAPTLQPAVDFITKTPNGPFIDTGMNVTFEQRGRVYLSVETIKEMAQVAGLLDNKNAQEKTLHDIAIYNDGYKAGLKEGEELVAKLMGVAGRLATGDYSDVIRNVEIDEDPEGNSGDESGEPASDSAHVPDAPVRKRK
jgi:hypothetical protein